MSDYGWLLGAVGLMIGGVLKGATGAGAPIVAVPVLALAYNVPLAVATLTFPSLFANIWQIARFRDSLHPVSFIVVLSGTAALGALVGSWLLVLLPPTTLMLAVSLAVYVYIAFRLMRPSWQLDHRIAFRLAAPLGFLGGILQGAAGLSAPVSLTFLNAMRLDRPRFIAVVSVFFFTMTLVQIPALAYLGVLTLERAGLSLLACLPLFGAMPVGAWLAKRWSKDAFDKVMLAMLALVATRLIVEGVWA